MTKKKGKTESVTGNLVPPELAALFEEDAGVGSEDYAPGFFQGLSGIGYQLLRLAQPELPCVLVFEPS